MRLLGGLTPDQVREIRNNPDRLGVSELARKFKRSRKTIYKIMDYKYYKWVTDEPCEGELDG